jgi:phosphoglycolate phosphatase-like HAD superfamily hydrolase
MTKKDCYVFDLDGTLCDVRHRRQYVATKPRNWDAWNAGLVMDHPHLPVLQVLQGLAQQHDILIVSGRSDDYRQQTEEWLAKYDVPYNNLYMRKYGDHRDDSVVKTEIADEIEKTHRILGVFDDRQRVVNMWIERGIWVFDVGQGKGNF